MRSKHDGKIKVNIKYGFSRGMCRAILFFRPSHWPKDRYAKIETTGKDFSEARARAMEMLKKAPKVPKDERFELSDV